MGLLTVHSGEQDYIALSKLTRQVLDKWNAAAGRMVPAAKLEVGFNRLVEVCDYGTVLLEQHFSNPPSAFKRVAALIVLGRLHPFLTFDPPQPLPVRTKFLPRAMMLFLPIGLRAQMVERTPGSPTPLTAKFRFPSNHYLLDFVKWLRTLEAPEPWPDAMSSKGAGRILFDQRRLVRMVWATSLVIENVYYGSEEYGFPAPPAVLRGKCGQCLENGDLEDIRFFKLLRGDQQ